MYIPLRASGRDDVIILGNVEARFATGVSQLESALGVPPRLRKNKQTSGYDSGGRNVRPTRRRVLVYIEGDRTRHFTHIL